MSLPQVLHEIILELRMSFSMSNANIRLNEILNFNCTLSWHSYRNAFRHLFIIVTLLYSIRITLIFIIMLCNIIHAFIISLRVVSSQKRAGPRIIENLAWSIPNAYSTSFLHASWALTKCFFFAPSGAEIVFTKVDHYGYILSAR